MNADEEKVPTDAEKREWLAGHQTTAVRRYRDRVRPHPTLESAVVAFEDATSAPRAFVTLPMVRLGPAEDM